MFESTRRRVLGALGIGTTASVAGCTGGIVPRAGSPPTSSSVSESAPAAKETTVDRVAADPTDVPDPIDRDEPTEHDLTLTVEEHTAEIEDGVTFDYMTFGGQIPGPMIRVRQGDTVNLTMENPPDSKMQHNVDLHAVYGTGGGSIATTAGPGSGNAMRFEAKYPGAFIYHCAVPNLDYHISAGMFGMILVEPKDGLPEVDHELYYGQHEIYTDKETGEEGHHGFSFDAMKREDPTYVVLNGEKYAYAAAKYGPTEVQKGDSVRVFMVDGGPNVSSNFHPIGNVWSRAYRDGGLPAEGDLDEYADKHIQTMKVPPGSCMIGEMETPVPERIKLVDHALSRVVRKGLLAEVDVRGGKENEVFDPEPDGPDEGPIYGDGGE